MSDAFWLPQEIRWTPRQVQWLLPHLYELREGLWPGQQVTGYTDVPGGQPSPRAPYETVCLVAAELDMRIERCGRDGVWLKWTHCEGKSVLEIAQGVGVSPGEVERGAGRAFAYICGRRKRRSYHRFVSHAHTVGSPLYLKDGKT